jgi:hypothetical protein
VESLEAPKKAAIDDEPVPGLVLWLVGVTHNLYNA